MIAIQPIHLNDTGPNVANLHKGLLFLIAIEPGISKNDRKTLSRWLAPELPKQTYGSGTAELVGTLQNQLKNWPNYLGALPKPIAKKVQNFYVSPITGRGNGDVDQDTADALNWLLKHFNAL